MLSAIFLLATAPVGRTYLNIGDPAPSIASVKWLKGTPVKSFQKGEVYMVEFWATWCGPCKENIPHLTDMAKKFAGKAKILGISIWESNDPSAADYMPRVVSFVKSQGEKMDYLVAADLPAGRVGKDWMKAADEGGIPTSFVIGRDGKIAWIGHPAAAENVLQQVVDDKWDVAAARDRRATEVETVRPIREAMETKSYRKAITLIDAAIAKKPEQARYYTYDRLVAQFHVAPKEAQTDADKIIAESNGDIGAYRMVVSIFASQKDLSADVYRYGRDLAAKAVEKDEMRYMFLAMSAEIADSLKDIPAAVKFQTEAVAVAEKDSHAPPEFVAFLKRKLAEFRAKEAKG